MQIIQLPLLFVGSKGEKRLSTVFETGANFSFIDKSQLYNLESPVHLERTLKLNTASHVLETSERVTLYFYIDDIRLSDDFFVVPMLPEEAIIGASTLQRWRIKLDFETNSAEVYPKLPKLQLI